MLLLWLVVSLPIVFVIYRLAEPTYAAFSNLRVEPVQPTQSGPTQSSGGGESRSLGGYVLTQVRLITSDDVLDAAIAGPSVAGLPVIAESKDPKADLRKKMDIEIIEKAYLIRVGLELADGNQAAAIVNAVVQSYLAQSAEHTRRPSSTMRANLTAQRKRLQDEIREKRDHLSVLLKKGTVDPNEPSLTIRASRIEGDRAQPAMSKLPEEHIQRLAREAVKTDLELIEAEARFEVREAADRASAAEKAQQSLQDDVELEARIAEEFQKDPAVDDLIEKIHDTKEQLDRAKRGAPPDKNPALMAAAKQASELMVQYTELWNSKYDEIRERLKVAAGTSQPPETIKKLSIRVAALKNRQHEQAKLFENWKAQKKPVNNDTFEAIYLTYQLDSLLLSDEKVKANPQQLPFEESPQAFRLVLVDPASAPKTPTNHQQLTYMAITPLAVFFLILGVFLAIEITTGRKAA